MRKAILVICFLSSALACAAQELEKDFFRQPLGTRVERLRQYPLEDQYKIFRYGNDKMEPPLTDLAIPIAERGIEAVPFLLKFLNSNPDDLTVRDILLILETMARSKTYDVRSNVALMNTLDTRVSAMKDSDWKRICQTEFNRLVNGK